MVDISAISSELDDGNSGCLTVVLPLPLRALSPNSRVHWATKAKAVREYRGIAKLIALEAIGRRIRPRWTCAKAFTRFFFADRRERDRDNLLAAMKSAYDGTADAGVVANDSGLVHMPVEMDIDGTNPRVEVRIEPL